MSYALVERLEIGTDARAADDGAAADPDRELVDRFRAGERSAFDELVRRYQRPLYGLAFRYLRNQADAADTVQRAFVRAYQSIGKFRGGASFRTWLYRIVINLSLNHIRDHRRVEPAEIADHALTEDAVGVGALLGAEASARLRAAVVDLPPKQRLVLELRVYDELPFREVAAIADCTENAAKVSFHHAVAKLRAWLGGEEGGR